LTKKRKRRQDKTWQKLLLLIIFLGMVALFGNHLLSLREPHVQVTSVKTTSQHQRFIEEKAKQAQKLQKQYNVLASITLSQAILESDWGNSTLASQYHNLFGIKASSKQVGKVLATQEYYDGKWVTIKAKFRRFSSDEESMVAHAKLFVNGTDWNSSQYHSVLEATNYKQAAKALYKDGYATDPNYPEKLITLIKRYRLDRYDQSY